MTTDRGYLERRWDELCRSAGFTGDVADAGRWLLDAHDAAGRAYHNLDHLQHCLAEFDFAKHLCQDPLAGELALWFHDSIYDPARTDNEERSAAWARSVLGYLGAAPELLEATANSVLATSHAEPPATADAQVVVDVDLAILGQPQPVFDAYEDAIRLEYRHVPDAGFRSARAAVLQRILDRPQIYFTLPFRARYETRARENLMRSIHRLSAAPAEVARPSADVAVG